MDITKLKIRDMRKMLDSGEISASELTQGYIERIKKYDGNVKSYITVTEENALESANAAQEKIKAGNAAPLCGIPMAIKDNICTDGVKTTCASKMLENFIRLITLQLWKSLMHRILLCWEKLVWTNLLWAVQLKPPLLQRQKILMV